MSKEKGYLGNQKFDSNFACVMDSKVGFYKILVRKNWSFVTFQMQILNQVISSYLDKNKIQKIEKH